MGALPKHKHSRSHRDRRRAHDALTPITLVKCSNCGEMHRAHHLCLNCNQYRGRQVLPPIEES